MVLTSILVYSCANSSFGVASLVFGFTLFLPTLDCDSLEELGAGVSEGRPGSNVC